MICITSKDTFTYAASSGRPRAISSAFLASLLPNKLNMIVVWLFDEMRYEIMRTSVVASKSKSKNEVPLEIQEVKKRQT